MTSKSIAISPNRSDDDNEANVKAVGCSEKKKKDGEELEDNDEDGEEDDDEDYEVVSPEFLQQPNAPTAQ